MHIDIVSDVICPWCFIGKRRLGRALALRPEIEPEITWRPFQLNPDMPEEGMERRAYLAAKFGDDAHADRIYASVSEAGATVGIPFAFDRIRRTPNTQHAHRLIRYAAGQDRADAVVEALFSAYFIEGRDIGDPPTLVALAGEAGLEPAAAAAWLAGPESREEVVGEDRGARRLGINAVPCFIFERQYAVSGAQEPEFFLPVFDLVRNGGQSAA
ncbi:MAG TPA: DsbA family oxidoreductase [Stellaceae bacterium]|nr:DsbA family oxidoreductase [Stellaceae bacterium]